VETFFNLLWVAVTLALCAVWAKQPRRNRAKSLLPAIGMQLVALAVLTAVLLPVISLTDDLQASSNPAETERVGRRADWQSPPDPSLASLPVALALLVAPPAFPQISSATFIATERMDAQPLLGFFRALAMRPPPSA
jgi:hypothetical protein